MSIVLIDISEEKHIKDNMFKSFKGRKKQNKVEKKINHSTQKIKKNKVSFSKKQQCSTMTMDVKNFKCLQLCCIKCKKERKNMNFLEDPCGGGGISIMITRHTIPPITK